MREGAGVTERHKATIRMIAANVHGNWPLAQRKVSHSVSGSPTAIAACLCITSPECSLSPLSVTVLCPLIVPLLLGIVGLGWRVGRAEGFSLLTPEYLLDLEAFGGSARLSSDKILRWRRMAKSLGGSSSMEGRQLASSVSRTNAHGSGAQPFAKSLPADTHSKGLSVEHVDRCLVSVISPPAFDSGRLEQLQLEARKGSVVNVNPTNTRPHSDTPEIRKYKKRFNSEILCAALWGERGLGGGRGAGGAAADPSPGHSPWCLQGSTCWWGLRMGSCCWIGAGKARCTASSTVAVSSRWTSWRA